MANEARTIRRVVAYAQRRTLATKFAKVAVERLLKLSNGTAILLNRKLQSIEG